MIDHEMIGSEVLMRALLPYAWQHQANVSTMDGVFVVSIQTPAGLRYLSKEKRLIFWDVWLTDRAHFVMPEDGLAALSKAPFPPALTAEAIRRVVDKRTLEDAILSAPAFSTPIRPTADLS